MRNYHCKSLDDDHRTMCGLSTRNQSYDYPMDFMENETGPAYLYDKCEICKDHPDLPMAVLGDLEEEI